MRNRRLLFEPLESRTVLSTVAAELTPAAVAPDHETVVAFVLEVIDASGQACSSLQTGQRLYLDILVEDLRVDGMGVYYGALDLLFDNNLVVLDGNITFGSTFPNLPNASWDEPGELDEVGAMGGFDAPGLGRMLFARLPFVAVAPGTLLFTSNPADVMPANEILVYGWNSGVPTDHVAYGSVAIEITGSPVAGTVTPPVVTLPEAPVFPQDGRWEIIVPPDDQIVPPPAEQVVPVPVAVEQDTYVAVPLLRKHLRLDRFVGMLDTHFLLASMSFNALSDPLPASSDVTVITGGPLMSHDGPLSPAGADSTPVLRPVEFAQMDADIPIGVVPGRTAYAVGSTRSANRPALGELLTNRLSISESWDELWDGESEE